ncbi:GcrA family cell cycle regulator [Sphingomonas corticis]|jgi:GcrA cell cycle regulator|uniref:GcrA cell cycle regulator n=1 Tax=Sphingomonas corticis TaxID=2722791 RepID=A0ABX1CK72_9SPHN|nr:GcrA family cell cycle regulator [Sphingomonas corticis]NJR78396.1 GcrA cell cycle regulator [Sphingomonas corticis]
MSWTEERIGTLKTMWEAGQTASQIAEALGGVSRNAVIGKAHRLGLQSRPSPVVSKEEAKAAAEREKQAAVAAPEPEPAPWEEVAEPAAPAPVEAVAPVVEEDEEEDEPVRAAPAPAPASIPLPEPRREPVLRSVGPGGFVRQAPGEQQPPIAPAPPRRLVPARTAPEYADKTSLLDLNDRICKWPLGHPGEPDFHFCGEKVNPGFPYCVAHCGHAYQAQLPRRDRRAPPLPFGGPRAR